MLVDIALQLRNPCYTEFRNQPRESVMELKEWVIIGANEKIIERAHFEDDMTAGDVEAWLHNDGYPPCRVVEPSEAVNLEECRKNYGRFKG